MASKIKVDTLETADGTGSITLNNPIAGVVTEDASGNVGIGVTPESSLSSPVTFLGVGNRIGIYEYDDGGNPVQYNNTLNDRGDEKYKVNGYASRHQQRDGVHNFQVAPSGTADSAISWTTAMTIANDGYCNFDFDILRGSTTPGASNSALYGKYGITHNSTHATRTPFDIQYNGSTVGSITRTTSSTSYNTSSDYRLKENVIPMSGSIDRLKELKPSRFNFIADADKTVDGFLAHEAQAIVPECVTGTKDAMMMEDITDEDGNVTGTQEVPDMQGIDQAKLVPLLTSALQDAIAKIEQLESRISALEVT